MDIDRLERVIPLHIQFIANNPDGKKRRTVQKALKKRKREFKYQKQQYTIAAQALNKAREEYFTNMDKLLVKP